MIALPHHLPFVRIGDNSLTLIQKEWLDNLLLDAVEGTFVPDWFALDIAKGIRRYLQNYEGTVIESEVLLEKIYSLLIKLNLPEVAERLEWNPPPLRISLPDLARRSNNSYEWGFLPLLEEKCLEAVESGAAFVEYHGLSDCVASLYGANREKVSVDEIRDEIEKRIDEYRQRGELNKPLYLVSVAQ